jgi:hypothetical protein
MVPDPDPNLDFKYSSGAPRGVPVAHLGTIGVAHPSNSSGALARVPLLAGLPVVHQMCTTSNT